MANGVLNKLTDAKCKAVKESGTLENGEPRKLLKLADGGGLYLHVSDTGTKGWRFKYRFAGRENSLSFGAYPGITLKAARARRDTARAQLAQGIDPSAALKEAKQARLVTFGDIGRAYLEKREYETTFSTQYKQDYFFEFLKPLHKQPIAAIQTKDILPLLRRIEKAGQHENAHRVAALASRVFRFAIQSGQGGAKHNPVNDLRGALVAVKTTSRAALTDPADVGGLLRSIDDYRGDDIVRTALKIAPLVFVRPKELRCATWNEFDLTKAEWRLPAERMKMKTPHLVPLATQTVALLKDLHQRTGRGDWVFPSINRRPLSDNSLTSALRRMGYTSEQMTWHGFRSTASTLLNELGFNSDIIELQLAHQERNRVKAVYDRSQRVPERKAMMQAYADYLDTLRATMPPVRAAA